MTFLRMICVIALLGFGVHLWKLRTEYVAIHSAINRNGFLPVPMPEGAQHNMVLLFTPLNCPKEGAQRAIALSKKLTARGIPNVRTSHYGSQTFAPTDEKLAAFKRLDVVMKGKIPIALVNGMGKANPTADEIILEYNKSK